MAKRRFNLPIFLLCLAIPLLSGFAVGFLTSNSMEVYQSVNKPPFAPPAILFPIVWTILYALMGVSLYLVYASYGTPREYFIFALQLAANLVWPFLFFSAQAFIAAFVLLIILWLLILSMILTFRKVNETAAYLQVPYIVWVTFAGVLNAYIAFAN